MYTLSAGLWEKFFKKRDYYVVIVGLDNVGKTTFLEQTKSHFVKGYGALNPARITSTVGLNIGKVVINNTCLNFWDLGGQEDLRTLWVNYYDEANALIFVVDATRQDLFEEVASVFKEVMSNEYVRMIPVLVAVNKSEIEGAAPAAEVRRILQDEHHLGDLAVLPVSALEGTNIDRCVRWIVRTLASQPLYL
ncbi:ADP-ribosylation factor protein 1 [Trichostrongylus colubriformis]|uniref:ADP-ribosylation factor-related protein 1 n=1 Tax=Trichostrongylus colubriformis TaxID=6319 RepID=A0AAN8ERF2_TRICO